MFSFFFFFWLTRSQYLCPQNSLETNVPPSKNFDLSHWSLIIPDKDATNEQPSTLVAGFNDSYFYTSSSDGSMSFYVPGDGGTTSGTHYPRSELRYLCNPDPSDNAHYNWEIKLGNSGVYQMWQNLAVDSSTTTKTIVSQIHGWDVNPLLKVSWETDGQLNARYQLDNSGDNEKTVGLVKLDSPYDRFDISTKVDCYTGRMQIFVNNHKYYDMNVSYWTHPNYFKAGNYLQSDDDSDHAIVHEYCLQVNLTGSYQCVYAS